MNLHFIKRILEPREENTIFEMKYRPAKLGICPYSKKRRDKRKIYFENENGMTISSIHIIAVFQDSPTPTFSVI